MRIALVTPGFSASEDDWCIPALLHLVRRLATRHEVYVLALRYPHLAREYAVSGARVQSLGGSTASGPGRLPLMWRAIRALHARHRTAPFDVIHGLWCDEPGFVAAAASLLTGTPALVSVMGGELVGLPDVGYGGQLNRANRLLTRVALRRAALVTAGSEYQRKITARFVPAGRLATAPLGVDLDLFHPHRDDDRSPIRLDGDPALLCVASLAPVKDHAALIRALARLRSQSPEAHLHLVGDGDPRALRQLAATLDVSQSVTFHGDIRHERLPGYYRSADVFVIASRHESQGLAPLEAAACGCPVIGTAVGVIGELDPESIPPPADDGALAGRILEVMNDPNARRERGRQGLSRVRETYSLDRSAERLESLYRALANEHRAKRDDRRLAD
jgi:glycosyltransferase involved in cell wall biosynthesis